MKKILLALVLLTTSIVFATAPVQADTPPEKSPLIERVIQLADHRNDGVLTRTFRNMGRCSQVCPLMRDIAKGHCKGGYGKCWCDERGSTTRAHIVCY